MRKLVFLFHLVLSMEITRQMRRQKSQAKLLDAAAHGNVPTARLDLHNMVGAPPAGNEAVIGATTFGQPDIPEAFIPENDLGPAATHEVV